jgi:hypothetical protein
MVPTRLVFLLPVLLVFSLPPNLANVWQPIACAARSVPVQTQDGWAAIKTDEGLLFVLNQPDIHFTLSIKGKDIKPLNDPEHIFFNVDGMVFQIQLAAVREFAPDAKERKPDSKALLAAHRDWESKFIEGLLGRKLKVQFSDAKLSGGGDAALWQFDMPEGMNADAKKQLYLTVVSEDYVVLLNGVANDTVSEETVRKYLLDTIGTLELSPKPIDVKKLSEAIRIGTKS